MINDEQHLLLRNFFSAYFHEDWPCDAENPEAVVNTYVRSATKADVRSLAEAIQSYSGDHASDDELETRLFSDLGCYYRPSADGLSANAWLRRLTDQLLRNEDK